MEFLRRIHFWGKTVGAAKEGEGGVRWSVEERGMGKGERGMGVGPAETENVKPHTGVQNTLTATWKKTRPDLIQHPRP